MPMQIGYALISTSDQNLALQEDALAKAGCKKVFSDVASGAIDARKGLTEALGYVRSKRRYRMWNHIFKF